MIIAQPVLSGFTKEVIFRGEKYLVDKDIKCIAIDKNNLAYAYTGEIEPITKGNPDIEVWKYDTGMWYFTKEERAKKNDMQYLKKFDLQGEDWTKTKVNYD